MINEINIMDEKRLAGGILNNINPLGMDFADAG